MMTGIAGISVIARAEKTDEPEAGSGSSKKIEMDFWM